MSTRYQKLSFYNYTCVITDLFVTIIVPYQLVVETILCNTIIVVGIDKEILRTLSEAKKSEIGIPKPASISEYRISEVLSRFH